MVDADLSIVDMPGYSFAQVPKARSVGPAGATPICGAVQTCAASISSSTAATAWKPVDTEVLDMLDKAAVSYQLVLTKADKIAKEETGRRRRSRRHGRGDPQKRSPPTR